MRTLSALALLAAVGCGGRGTSVVVQGPAPDRAQIVGDWAGEFQSETGRVGTIHFHLAGTGDTAWGDLQMLPAESMTDPATVHNRPTLVEPPLVLSIRFVQVARDRVRGQLEPYRDPVCGCRVTSVFYGTIRGDVIAGDYVTRHSEHPQEIRGTWRVTRLVPRAH